jgi:uncharacterized protein (DUF1015 family)
MAEVRPLPALHYDLAAVGSLGDVVAPPYDVIDADARRRLVARSPFNVVEIDLPEADGADPYEHAAETLEQWTLQGILRGDREPSIWGLEQDYVGPDGVGRTRRGVLCRVRLSAYGAGLVRPHERTHPGPKEDRLRLTRATRHNLSPIFSLYEGDAWPCLGDVTSTSPPWGGATDLDGTANRAWRIDDPAVAEAVADELDDAELLIADGHHRYETALAYADEVGGEGPHRYTLMSLTSLADRGLTVFGYHRVLTDLADAARQDRLVAAAHEHFEVAEVPLDRLDPAGEDGVGVFGYVDANRERGYRLRLRDTAAVDAALAGHGDAYRRLDAAILEALLLRGALGMTDEELATKRGVSYAASVEAALAALDGGGQAAFILRPTPVDQVRAVAAAGETMPPKSTYFFPKLPTGIVFNPLS